MPINKYKQRNAVVWEAQDRAKNYCHINIINLIDSLCNNGKCQGVIESKIMYYDDNHMTLSGSKNVNMQIKTQ
jgi:hypothetical protein